jgi:acetyl-CoA acyltransferase
MTGNAFIISAVRSPVGLGKPTGKLVPIAPVDLTAMMLKEVVRRAGIDPELVEDVIWGVVTPVGDQVPTWPGWSSKRRFSRQNPGC